VHGHLLRTQFAELDAQHLVERNALEKAAYRLMQFWAEFESWSGHGACLCEILPTLQQAAELGQRRGGCAARIGGFGLGFVAVSSRQRGLR
jgi:hypothetical protein